MLPLPPGGAPPALLTSPVAVSVALSAIFFPLVSPDFPFALFRPLPSPLVAPSRRLVLGPLLPMSRGDAVVVHGHEQDGPRHELRADNDPRAVVSGTDVPATIGKGPVL